MRSILLAAALCACAATAGRACTASYYGAESGRFNANGSRFRPRGLSVAHPTARLGSHVRVTILGTTLVLPVLDRGPARWTGRCLDVSAGAARAFGMISRGLADARIDFLGAGHARPRHHRHHSKRKHRR